MLKYHVTCFTKKRKDKWSSFLLPALHKDALTTSLFWHHLHGHMNRWSAKRKLLTGTGFQEMHYPYACSFSTPSLLPCGPCVFVGSSGSCQVESVYHTLFWVHSTRKQRAHMHSVIILTWQKKQSACSLCACAQSAIEERIILTTSSVHYWKLPLTLYCNRKCFMKCQVWENSLWCVPAWFMLKWKETI